MTTKTKYYKGQVVELFLNTTVNGIPSSVIVESVDIISPNGSTVLTINGLEAQFIENGTIKISFVPPFDWVEGKYVDRWNVRVDGVLTKVDGGFFLSSNTWKMSTTSTVVNFDFVWTLLQKEFTKGCKEYIRVIVKEIYDRAVDFKNAQCMFIHYISEYRQETTEWQQMFFSDGMLMALMDTSNMDASSKWYIQIKITMDSGETILSPLLKFTIQNQYVT